MSINRESMLVCNTMIMVTTIQQALRPFLLTFFIMGFSSYPIKQSKSRISRITCLSILYSVIIWFAYAYLYYHSVTLFTWKKLYLTTIYEVSAVIDIFTTIVSVIMSFYHQEKLRMCIKRLAAVNDTLEQLGTPKAYQKIYTYSKQIVIGWIVYIIITNFNSSLQYLTTGHVIGKYFTWALFQPYILNHFMHINAFVDLLFIFFLWYIGTRFDKVNEHMRYLLMSKNRVPHGRKTVVTLHRYVICTDDYKRILWTLMHLHLELCRITRELNLMFGTQMTFEMLSYIASITVMCFDLNIFLMKYREIISLFQWFSFSFWTLIFIVRLYMINYICECVKVKAKQIDKIFHELTNIIRYADIWKEIYQFILQAIHHPLKFTGMGLFYLGNDFLRKLCSTVLMYVIIMTQMEIPIS